MCIRDISLSLSLSLFLPPHSLAAGASPTATDADGQTPLHKAAAGGHAGVCGALLAAPGGAGAVTAVDRRGRAPVDLAASEVVRAVMGGLE